MTCKDCIMYVTLETGGVCDNAVSDMYASFVDDDTPACENIDPAGDYLFDDDDTAPIGEIVCPSAD